MSASRTRVYRGIGIRGDELQATIAHPEPARYVPLPEPAPSAPARHNGTDGRDGQNPAVLGPPSAGPTPPPCPSVDAYREHASFHRIRDGRTLCDACQPTPAVAS